MMFTDRIDESGFWHRRSWAVAGLMVVFVGVASCAGNGPRTVTFTADGNTCTHDAGSDIYRRPTIVLVNNVDRKVGLAVWPVPAGTTANDMPPGDYPAGEPEGMMVIEAGGEESGFVSLERGTGAMVDCYLNDVPSAEGTLARVFFDIPLD